MQKIVIALDLDQVRGMTAATFANHLVLLTGSKGPTGGFARPPATPTYGYARLHWAHPGAPARFGGVAVALDQDAAPDPVIIRVVSRVAEAILADALVTREELPVLLRVERSAAGDRISYSVEPLSASKESTPPTPPATDPGEAVADDHVLDDEPDDDSASNQPAAGNDPGSANPVATEAAPADQPDRGAGDGGDVEHGAGDDSRDDRGVDGV